MAIDLGSSNVVVAVGRRTDEAAYLGAEGIAFLAGKWQEETKEQTYGQLLKTTVHLCEYAKSKGMYVNLEVFDYDCDKACLLYTSGTWQSAIPARRRTWPGNS